MSKETNGQSKPFNVIPFALVVFVMATAIGSLYYIQFSANGASGDPASWGAFGDYFGGTLNPIIGLFTIIILAMTLHLNSEQLQQSRIEVNLSQEALKVAMEELKRGQALQEMTEKSLRDQIDAMNKQSDMTSAVNLHTYWRDVVELNKRSMQSSNTEGEHDKYEQLMLKHSVKQGELAQILWKEHERLIIKYGTASSTW